MAILKYGEKCPNCGAEQEYATNKKCHKCKFEFVEPAPPPAPRVPRPPPGCSEYKVITQRDEYFASKFNPEVLQDMLNLHAAEGWRVVSMAATDAGSFFGSFWAKGGGSTRQELVVLLERTVPAEAVEV